MLTLTYAPDGTSSWSNGIVLCNTSRSITELDVKFNHRRQISVEQLATVLGSGAAALAQDFSNWRHTFSLRVRRSVDFTSPTPVAFPDPEGALAFALNQPASFTATGTLRIQLVGVTTNTTLYLLNCAVEAINLEDWLGIGPAFQYTFNGGLISSTSPF
jgi:hypothetical protein